MPSCIRCGSEQKFPRKRRPHPEGVQIFIRCTACRWEDVIYTGSERKYRLQQDVEQLAIRAEKSPSLQGVLRRRRRRLANEP